MGVEQERELPSMKDHKDELMDSVEKLDIALFLEMVHQKINVAYVQKHTPHVKKPESEAKPHRTRAQQVTLKIT